MHRLILFILMTFTSAICFHAVGYDFEVDGIYYELPDVSGDTCIVVGGDADKIGDTLTIPGSVTYRNKTFTVKSIAYRAFEGSKIKHLTIDEGVFEISYSAFRDSKLLESVEINGVTDLGAWCIFGGCTKLSSFIAPLLSSLGSDCFAGCTELSSFNAPLLQSFGDGCFSGTGLVEFKIPETMESIPASSFSGSDIQIIDFPPSIKKIEYGAFNRCENLKHVFIPESIIEIDEGAFSNCVIESLVIQESIFPLKIYPSFYEWYDLALSKDDWFELIYGSFYNTKVHSYENVGRNLNIVDRNKEFANKYYPRIGDSNQRGEKITVLNPIYLQSELIIGSTPGYQSSSYYIYNITEPTAGSEHSISRRIIDIPYFIHEDSFERIIVKSDIPPVFSQDPEFKNKDYMNWNIYVPVGAKSAYENAPIWKNFWNIIESDFSDLNSINDTTTEQPRYEVARFDINGMPVGDDYTGLVIIRYSDGSTQKKLIK